MTAIRLTRAHLCTNCELITDGWARCPQCGKSEALMPLTRWVRPLEGGATNEVLAALNLISGVAAPRGEE